MAFFSVKNVAIRGISACVPSTIEENKDLAMYHGNEAAEVIKSTGIERKHVCRNGETGSDLATKAAEKLISDLGWDKSSIDILGYVTQTQDYLNHPDSYDEEVLKIEAQRYPMKRFGKPEEVAYGIIYLLSEAASFVTGSSIVIDGGFTLQ